MLNSILAWGRESAKADARILRLIPFDLALNSHAVITNFNRSDGSYNAIVGIGSLADGTEINGISFIQSLLTEPTYSSYRKEVQKITRILDFQILQAKNKILPPEKALEEIRAIYPKELQIRVDKSLVTIIPRSVAFENKGVFGHRVGNTIRPIYVRGMGLTTLANEFRKEDVKKKIAAALGLSLEVVKTFSLDLSTPDVSDAVFQNLLKEYYPEEAYTGMQTREATRYGREFEQKQGQFERSSNSIIEDVGRSSASAIFDKIITTAYRLRAADVQIKYDPDSRSILQAHFINGVWVDQPSFSIGSGEAYNAFMKNTVHRTKGIQERDYNYNTSAGGNIEVKEKIDGEHKKISGRILYQPINPDHDLEFLMATVRIMRPVGELLSVEEIGFLPHQFPAVLRIKGFDSGIIIVTGPMGSGKQVTLLCLLLDIINESDGSKKALTFEDPIEYFLKHKDINQSRLRENRDTFKQLGLGLKSGHQLLYLDEVNHPEKAKVALTAAETGHLTLTSLHVAFPQQVVPRLEGMGITRDRISQIRAVLSQRLLPVLCDNCKIPQPLHSLPRTIQTANLIRILRFYEFDLEDFLPFKSSGRITGDQICPKCNGTGVKGRTATIEIWEPGFQAFQIVEGERIGIIRRTAQNFVRGTPDLNNPDSILATEKYTTMAYNGLHKVKAGQVSLSSLFRWCEVDPGMEGLPGYDVEAKVRQFVKHEFWGGFDPTPASNGHSAFSGDQDSGNTKREAPPSAHKSDDEPTIDISGFPVDGV